MYVFTRDGLVAIAHYDPEMNNHEGWLEDQIRRRSMRLLLTAKITSSFVVGTRP